MTRYDAFTNLTEMKWQKAGENYKLRRHIISVHQYNYNDQIKGMWLV
jgi:hypothetical protein